ncbi:MAG: sensor histidine kinase [Clostridiaceae bacterium]|nr:sensor histidine kinase [Clostridiaceae bacterium]
MNKLTHSLPAKVAAIFLLVITILSSLFGAVGIYLLAEYGFYHLPVADIKKSAFESITRGYANRVFYEYLPTYKYNNYNLYEYQEDFSAENTNFLFVLKDSKGSTILSTYSNEEYQFIRTYTYEGDFLPSYDAAHPDISGSSAENDTYTINCYVNKTLTANDKYSMAEYWVNLAYKMRYALIPITIVFAASAIILFIFLMCSAGRRKGEDKVIPNGIDKIPFDAFLLVLLFIVFVELSILDGLSHTSEITMILFVSAFGIIDLLLVLLTCMTFATRCKIGSLWKNTIIYRILKFIFSLISKVYNSIIYIFINTPLIGKTILLILGLSLLEFMALAAFRNRSSIALIWFFEKLILVPATLYIVIGLRKLQTSGEKIAAGDLGYQVDTKYLFWDFKRHGENLNSISQGMSKAVDARMKSERLKTELITNVSHDIKTPLTSIINYVDLIKKEDIEGETLQEYINVLDRQSARLRKLIEDLVEASKASTGNIEVMRSRTEIGILLTQTVGEYEEKLKENSLDLILKKPEDEIFIMADGKLLWRVFDNLINNICKYAQPSTRAYINLDTEDHQAVITFRNISKFPLNLSSDELLDRFIRGDSSRSTEGSGLGLSIAKSLTDLQNGTLDLYVDGDLFKVILKFDII